MFITQSKEAELGTEAFRQLLSDPKIVVIMESPEQHRVSQIFARLVDAAKRSAHSDLAKALEWEVALVRDDMKAGVGAAPGGKVIVYTGMLRFATTDNELAGMMGHGLAYSLARHGAERMSRSILSQIGKIGAFWASTGRKKEDLAIDRTLEEEADRIGLLLAADAGYDPGGTIELWIKLEGPSSSHKTMLETHLPEARERYHSQGSTTIIPSEPR